MANALYPLYKQSTLSQSPSVDIDSDNIKVLLVKTAQAYNAAHQFISDLTGSNIVARSANLASKTVTNGTFDAADITFTTPTAGFACNLIVVKDTGTDATSPLIAFMDSGTGLPVTTNGGDVNIVWDSGTDRIFSI